ncbi:MAG: sulfate adenylyltransferase subunit 2 [Candidatus Azotimanducaceae bacterium]|jgi:sulfate adenylyltransferase subunit 2
MQLPLSNPEHADFWDTQGIHDFLVSAGHEETLRTTERHLEQAQWLPESCALEDIVDERGLPLNGLVVASLDHLAKRKRWSNFVLQSLQFDGQQVLMVNDGRKGRRWRFVEGELTEEKLLAELRLLVGNKNVLIWPHAEITKLCRTIVSQHESHVVSLSDSSQVTFALTAYTANETPRSYGRRDNKSGSELTHLDRLEAESLHIMREVVSQAENPVMLYSVGKDSSVMLHLARKAFYPSPPPFPLMHVDTRWKFRAMYEFRDWMAKELGMDLIVHINPEGIEKDINPFDHGSALHTDIMKTEGLKQALDEHKFDVAFGGARRDEEKSRAKERIFSFRSEAHRWDPKNQRPELWNLYNCHKKPGESIRVFPLSNWTELDIWQYIYREAIPIVPLYFAAERPIVERDGMLIMVDDARMQLLPGEKIETRQVRFRTLGCYPLTGAFESSANNLSSIILELLESRTSERQGRAIDSDSSGSMEKKKQEGYF